MNVKRLYLEVVILLVGRFKSGWSGITILSGSVFQSFGELPIERALYTL